MAIVKSIIIRYEKREKRSNRKNGIIQILPDRILYLSVHPKHHLAIDMPALFIIHLGMAIQCRKIQCESVCPSLRCSFET